MGWLLVGVDVGVPLHRAILLAGLGSFYCSRARCCCHGGRWNSATREGSLQFALRRLICSQMLLSKEQRATASPAEQRIAACAWCSSRGEDLKEAVHSSPGQGAFKWDAQKQGREQSPRVGQLQGLIQCGIPSKCHPTTLVWSEWCF